MSMSTEPAGSSIDIKTRSFSSTCRQSGDNGFLRRKVRSQPCFQGTAAMVRKNGRGMLEWGWVFLPRAYFFARLRHPRCGPLGSVSQSGLPAAASCQHLLRVGKCSPHCSTALLTLLHGRACSYILHPSLPASHFAYLLVQRPSGRAQGNDRRWHCPENPLFSSIRLDLRLNNSVQLSTSSLFSTRTEFGSALRGRNDEPPPSPCCTWLSKMVQSLHWPCSH